MNIELEQGEVVIKEIREHVFFVLLDVLSFFLLALGPVILTIIFIFVPFIIPNLFPLTLLLLSAWPLLPLWILIVWGQFGTSFTFYYLHYLVITNERIIEVEQRNFFNREVSTFRLENIQDITVVSSGIIASLLKYGDVILQTASKHNDFKIRNAPRPEEIKMLINEQHDSVMARYNVTGKTV